MESVRNNIKVKLYKNFLTDDLNDFSAKVISERTVNIADICKTAVNRAKAPTTAEAMSHNVDLFFKEMAYQLANGFSVNTGYFTANAQVRGVFNSKTETFNPKKHSILFRFNQGSVLRNEIPNVAVQVLGVGETGIVISHVQDKKTGSVNDLITPGGALKIRGGKLKIAGDNPDVGVFFEDEAGNTVQIEARDLIVNNPSELIVEIPQLAPGKYQLVVRNQYAVSSILKEPRTTVFEKVLTVAANE
jgi:hypothetical protein